MTQRRAGDLGHPVRVLHIEDTDLIAKVVADTLAKKAVGTYDVHRAVSLAKGLAYARKKEVDVVLLDLGLPDSRGPEGVRAIRAALPHVPVVVLSADDDPETRRRVYEAGAVAFLDKADMRATALEACLRAAVATNRCRTLPL
jgi:DNA-binding NarL/FixJ family response regulator